MSDIVERLRDDAPNMPHDETEAMLHEAADEIERLRKTVDDLCIALNGYIIADSDEGNPHLSRAVYDRNMEKAKERAFAALSRARGDAQ